MRARNSSAKTFVEALPETQNLISQSGTNLGRSKARLAIARAIIRGADICIRRQLLRPDLTTDARLRAAIKQHLSGANIIIVAQRVSTILDADRIIMDKGEVVASAPRELLESCEIYRDIVRSCALRGGGVRMSEIKAEERRLQNRRRK